MDSKLLKIKHSIIYSLYVFIINKSEKLFKKHIIFNFKIFTNTKKILNKIMINCE